MVWEEIFKGSLLAMATRILHGTNYLKEFEKGPPKEHSCEI